MDRSEKILFGLPLRRFGKCSGFSSTHSWRCFGFPFPSIARNGRTYGFIGFCSEYSCCHTALQRHPTSSSGLEKCRRPTFTLFSPPF